MDRRLADHAMAAFARNLPTTSGEAMNDDPYRKCEHGQLSYRAIDTCPGHAVCQLAICAHCGQTRGKICVESPKRSFGPLEIQYLTRMFLVFLCTAILGWLTS